MVGGGEQTAFVDIDRVRDKNGQFRGSRKGERKRPGVGRPITRGRKRASERHQKRAVVKPSVPLHIIMRAAPNMPSLRDQGVFAAIRLATYTAFGHDERAINSGDASAATKKAGKAFHITHISIQRTHIHLIVEASDRMALARGMQAFGISAAKHINAVRTERARDAGRIRRDQKISGQVFADRYHAVPLTTPTQVRNTIAYVLNNWRKHQEHHVRLAHAWQVDPFSSAIEFEGWRGRNGKAFAKPSWYFSLFVWEASSWLLRVGWRKLGPVGITETPGGHE
ncbi:MAG: transposase [Kofleriaceae bacterium]